MKLSIITSLYKSENHIKKWIHSVTKASEDLSAIGIDHEFVVVSNSPNAEEKLHLEKLRRLKNFNIIEVPLEGIYATWNRGIDNATGEVFTFWNVDDKRFVNAIVDGVKFLENLKDNQQDSAGLVYFPFIYKRYIRVLGLKILAKIKIFFPPKFDKTRFSKEMHCGPFFMFNKELFSKAGRFNENFKIAGDFEWCARAATVSDFHLSKVIAGIFTNDGQTLSGSKSDRHKVENEMVKEIINK